MVFGGALAALLIIAALGWHLLGADGQPGRPALTERALIDLIEHQDAAAEAEDMTTFSRLYAAEFRVRRGVGRWERRTAFLRGWRRDFRRGDLAIVSTSTPAIDLRGADQARVTRTVIYRYKEHGQPSYAWKVEENYLVVLSRGTPKIRQEQDYGYLTVFLPLIPSDVPARITVTGRHHGQLVVNAERVFRSAKGQPRWFVPVNANGRRSLESGDRVNLMIRGVNVETGDELVSFDPQTVEY